MTAKLHLEGSDTAPRLYFFCRQERRWQPGRCRHWRCKRKGWFPK